jgi:hypothetical protein
MSGTSVEIDVGSTTFTEALAAVLSASGSGVTQGRYVTFDMAAVSFETN